MTFRNTLDISHCYYTKHFYLKKTKCFAHYEGKRAGKTGEINFLFLILNESKWGKARISSGMCALIGISCLLLLLCMPCFLPALGDVAGLIRCYWTGRTCSTEPLASSALWDAFFLQFWSPSLSGDRKSKLSVRRHSKSLCAWGFCCRKTQSQSLLTGHRSGLGFWLQRCQFGQKYERVISQTCGSSGCSDRSPWTRRHW